MPQYTRIMDDERFDKLMVLLSRARYARRRHYLLFAADLLSECGYGGLETACRAAELLAAPRPVLVHFAHLVLGLAAEHQDDGDPAGLVRAAWARTQLPGELAMYTPRRTGLPR